MTSMLPPENSRLEREKDFHDKVFSDSSERDKVVGRFYKTTQSVSHKYHSLIIECANKAKVIEYGCGMGSSAFLLSQNGAKLVIGIDISPVAIDIAKNELNNVELPGDVEFQVMNAEDLQFEPSSVDLICGTGILHHLDIKAAMGSIAKVLKTDGSAIFMEPLGHSPFINLFRRLTPQARTEDEHPLLENDLEMIKSYFSHTELNYYYLTSLAASLLVGLPGFKIVQKTLEGFDRQLFKIPFLRKQAWIVIIKVSNPIK